MIIKALIFMIHETNDQNICKDLIGIDTIEKLGNLISIVQVVREIWMYPLPSRFYLMFAVFCKSISKPHFFQIYFPTLPFNYPTAWWSPARLNILSSRGLLQQPRYQRQPTRAFEAWSKPGKVINKVNHGHNTCHNHVKILNLYKF